MFTNVSRPSAVDVLRPFAVGDTFYADTTSTLAKLPIGTEGQVYVVASGVPVWSSAVVLTSLSVIDSGFFIIGSSDPTKRINFEADAQTTGDTLTINAGAQTDSRTLTVPVLTGNATLAVLSETQTFTGAKTFSAVTTVSNSTDSDSTGAGALVASTGGIYAHKSLYAGKGSSNTFNVLACGNGGTYMVGFGGGVAAVLQGFSDHAFAYADLSVQNYGNALVIGGFTAVASEKLRVTGGTAPTGGGSSDILMGDGQVKICRGGGIGLSVITPTDASAIGAAAIVGSGGATFAKNLITGQGRGAGVASTVTAAATTTLTSASAEIQTFTGSTTQTIQFPAANLFGAGIAVLFTINNQSSGTVTPTCAGADTFQGGGTTDPVLAGATTRYASNGVSVWLKV